MSVFRHVSLSLARQINWKQPCRRMGVEFNRDSYWMERIGRREVVGFGYNGQPVYADRYNFPFPAIRYKETTNEIQCLYEKQKCDWRLLTCEEKKALYRANFCLTYAEFQAPLGEWMETIAYILILCCCGIWVWIFLEFAVVKRKPHTWDPELMKAQMKRRLDLRQDPIWGFSSYFDFDKMDWKPGYSNMPENPYTHPPKLEGYGGAEETKADNDNDNEE